MVAECLERLQLTSEAAAVATPDDSVSVREGWRPGEVWEGWRPGEVREGWRPGEVWEGWRPGEVWEGWRPGEVREVQVRSGRVECL